MPIGKTIDAPPRGAGARLFGCHLQKTQRKKRKGPRYRMCQQDISGTKLNIPEDILAAERPDIIKAGRKTMHHV